MNVNTLILRCHTRFKENYKKATAIVKIFYYEHICIILHERVVGEFIQHLFEDNNETCLYDFHSKYYFCYVLSTL